EYREQQKKNYKKMVAFYAKKQGVRKEIIDLPGEKDFQENYTEIKTGSLVPGKYMILASNSPDFNFDKNIVSYSQMEVSRISYMSRKRGNDLLEFYVMDRSTGQPLRNVRAQLMYRKYSNTWGKYYDKKGKVFKTNKHGYFKISQKSKVENYFHIEFRKGKDVLYTENSFSLYRPYQRYRKYVRTVFFVDRGIYRPGQTVYFKGIKLRTDTKDGEKNKILKNYGATITLYDRNRQKVATLKRRTNEYGTFSGSFTLPTGLINGNMFIDDGHGRVNFSVEEYKRPKFEVSFKPLEKTFRLNDTVTVTGTAKAYAGYPIDNAQVKFRVVRTAFYPYRWYWWSYTPPSPSMEIKNGVVKTDEKGKYEITFKAIPDESLLKKNKPAFRYMVYADITDINGETRSSTKTVTIGYTALMLRMHIAGELDRDKGRYAYSINSTNLSGEFAAAAGKIAVYKLREPGRIFRRRLWRKPNTFAIKKDKFYRLFPNDVYDNENNIRAWKRGKKVHTQIYDTGKNKKLAFTGIKRWKTGKYLVEMTAKDRYGNDVKEIKYFTLYSSRGKKVPYPLLNWFTIPKSRVEPGGKAVILIGTSEKNVRVLYELEYRGSIIKKKYLRLNNEQKKITIPIKEKHRGNIGVRLSFIRHNRIFTHSRSIYVPWTNKELDVSFGTFRNKLNPGEKEKWRIRIKGKKKDLVAAEMVATLYDASLDAFRANHWSFNIYPGHYPLYSWGRDRYFNTRSSHSIGKTKEHYWYARKTYDRLNWYGFYWRYYSRKSRRYKNGGGSIRGMSRVSRDEAPLALEEVKESEEDSEAIADAPRSLKKKTKGKALAGNGKPAPSPEKLNGKAEDNGHATAEAAPVKVRTNFSETAFFYPHLKTNKNGEVIISFEIPEALTKWKMMGFAHTKKLEYGFVYNELVTQKELMVVPNLPRFFREGDSMTLTSKITNLTEDKLSGKAKLFLFDAATMKPLNGQFKNRSSETAFTARKGGSALVRWNIAIPENVDAVTYRVTARAGKFSDGEEQALPVLKNRMLVTESMPLPVRSKQTKHFTFKKLVNSGDSTTLRHHKVTLEFTSNPAWYAVQALPYLMEYPFECMEQTFSRYYANSIASHIVNTNPKIKRVFDVWQKTKGSNALLSNLEKNQELKSLLLQETPWVMDANNETERKKRISVLFNFNRMANELGRALKKLEEGQLSSGAWSWFKGMRENRYITRHIVSGFAHLGQLKVKDLRKDKRIWKMVKKAVHYLDRKIREDYESLKRREVDMSLRHIGYHQIHYLYARSYFKDIEFYKWDKEAFEYYKGQAKKYWLDFNRYSQGMISLAMDRYKEKETALAIVKSIKEHALYSEEMGMYWKDSYGYYWYQAPIETHALLIEVFSEVADDQKSVDDLKTWLLKQKQTQDWKTTKATANACYALLLRGDDWLKENKLAEITLGSMKIEPKKMDSVKVEAGTGYFKTSWSGADIKPEMGKVKVVNRNNVVAWGALYWQYFENLDKITPHETPLKLKKQLFVERSSDTGPVLFPLDKSAPKIGDRIKVRIELRVDRTMEYVHMKDMRASGFEPENVISRYKWQDGLGYYESTKDASTNFFFDYLPKGTYVFEYPLRVTHEGDFSNGITQIQCMYAPEFTSHSEGVRVKVGD
ncbi:MAG: hypothetical protein GY754_31800, partial [bacterium]|nr:hypothetical protein [bacterium]